MTYNVADLVVPIPNFVPTADGSGQRVPRRHGERHRVRPAARRSARRPPRRWPWWPAATARAAPARCSTPACWPRWPRAARRTGPAGAKNQPAAGGPGGLGGGAQADFDSLIDLITSTVRPTTWDDVGGPGSIAPFETNLSLVVSQTQEVHEEIVDLLEQLRRLQDLQVTIEVRFITLNDNFFERIGVNFDFDINDNVDRQPGPRMHQRLAAATALRPAPATIAHDNSTTGRPGRHVGTPAQRLQRRPGRPLHAEAVTAWPCRSSAASTPRPGPRSASPSSATSRPTSSSTPPKATNAATCSRPPRSRCSTASRRIVSDMSQSPFVISVIPVVGDFAAAQQPVIVVLSEGTFMTVQAVVSNDRRFVRLTVVPFFSNDRPP